MNILDDIIEQKKLEIENFKSNLPIEELQKQVKNLSYVSKKLTRKQNLQLIAEIKRKSPSKGLIRTDFQPVELARNFTQSGAAAISVLTDRQFFGGSLEIFKEVRIDCNVPLLRKDFVVDEYQIWQTKIIKADIILLIVKVLKNNLSEFLEKSLQNNLQCLIEIQDQFELDQTLEAINPFLSEYSQQILIGINNRNLATFEVDIENAIQLARQIPTDLFVVAESGISQTEQLKQLAAENFSAVLIGEGLAKNPKLLDFFKNN